MYYVVSNVIRLYYSMLHYIYIYIYIYVCYITNNTHIILYHTICSPPRTDASGPAEGGVLEALGAQVRPAKHICIIGVIVIIISIMLC